MPVKNRRFTEMKFKQGTSGNPQGRPRGSKNKATSKLVDIVNKIVKDNLERLQDDLDLLEPHERIRAIVSLISYSIPKKQAINVQQSLDYEYQKLTNLLEVAPDEVVDKIADKVISLHERNEGVDDEEE